MSDFEDIAIVDLDVKKTTWSRVHSAMRSVYLRLSREPDVAWARFFHEERNSRINVRRHGLWIEDDYIVLDCFLDEVEPHHLPDVNRSIDFANRKSRELEGARREQVVATKVAVETERDSLAELRERIRRKASNGATPHPPSGAPVEAESRAEISTPKIAKEIASLSDVDNAAPTTANPFDARREDLRARFRAALESTKDKARDD